MLKLLIADDEYIVIEAIKFIINKYLDNIQVVGTAQSGREVIEKAYDLKPDIILVDIHMPGINGIDAIKEIKEKNNDIIFVIITAYEHFNYAKEALKLGVHDYILKPVNKNKIIDTLNSIDILVNKNREIRHREIILKEKIEKIVPHMEGQFIYSQLLNGKVIKDISFYEDIFGMDISHGFVIMALIDEVESEIMNENLKNSLQKQRFYDLFSLELKRQTPCLIGPPLLDRVVAYIPTDKTMDPYVIRNMAINIANKIEKNISHLVKINFKIGIGRAYNIDEFQKSSNEAYMAVSVIKDTSIWHFEDLIPSLTKANLYPSNKEKRLVDKVITGDIDCAIGLFEEIFSWLSVNFLEDIDEIKSKLIELLIILKRSIPYEIETNKIEEGYLAKLLKIKNIKELKISYINYLDNVVRYIEMYRKNEMSGLIVSSLEYIKGNYNKDINLSDVAREVNMSYHYFSKFFKESMGTNFIDYLTEIRIEKSKEMLNDPTMNIKEICHSIGYSDPNYFSKTFKKITGLTPTEYRANFV